MKEKGIKLPDTSEAEEWLTPEIFKYQGKYYRVLPHGQIIETNSKGVKRGS